MRPAVEPQQRADSQECWRQVVRLRRGAGAAALERFLGAHGLLGVVVGAALRCRPACLVRTRTRCALAAACSRAVVPT